jgi:uncharacterized delta-60 repeat protein
MKLRSLALTAALSLLLLAPTTASALTQSDLDASFGGTGIVTPSLPAANTLAPVAAQPDGKTVGAYTTTSNVPVAFRLNVDGSLDSSFGTGGRVDLAGFGGTTSELKRVLVAPDGTIYVVGSVTLAGDDNDAIWALTPAGAPKTSFNATGSRKLPLVGIGENEIADGALTLAGDIVVVATANIGGDDVVSLRIVSPAGVTTTDVFKQFAGDDFSADAAAVLPDGRIAVGALYEPPAGRVSAVAIFSSAGVYDGTFGQSAGLAYFGAPIQLTGDITRVFSAGGQIGVVGQVGYAAALGLYSSTGQPAPTLGSLAAARLLPLGASVAISIDGGAVAAGKVVAVGYAQTSAAIPSFIARYNADGSTDSSFATGGAAPLPVAAGSSPTFSLQPDGKYVVALVTPSASKLTFVRYWGDSPAPQPASVAFAKSVKSKLKASKAKKFAGTTGGTGVTKVELAIQKVNSKLLKKSKKCTYVKSAKATTKNFKAVSGKCVPGSWLTAKGTASWSVKLSKALKPGKYVLSARSTGFLGFSTVITKSVTLTK